MKKFKLILQAVVLATLFGCTSELQKNVGRTGYLKTEISQAELQNSADFKRYYYTCRNLETGDEAYLSGYFPLSLESRRQENFGFYFQLAGEKAQPFDHLENRTLGRSFEVTYRSYQPIQGSYVHLVAREHSSTYYKSINGEQVAWLKCQES